MRGTGERIERRTVRRPAAVLRTEFSGTLRRRSDDEVAMLDPRHSALMSLLNVLEADAGGTVS